MRCIFSRQGRAFLKIHSPLDLELLYIFDRVLFLAGIKYLGIFGSQIPLTLQVQGIMIPTVFVFYLAP